MMLTRRAFLIVAGAGAFDWRAWHAPSFETFVIDETLRAHFPFETSARITPLIGDAGWLWHTRLSREKSIAGITRPADAFVLTHFATHAGLRTTQRALGPEAVFWALG